MELVKAVQEAEQVSSSAALSASSPQSFEATVRKRIFGTRDILSDQLLEVRDDLRRAQEQNVRRLLLEYVPH